MQDEEPTLDPPSAKRVALRALVFVGLTCRADLEDDASNNAAREFHERFLEWLSLTGALEEAEGEELHVLSASLGDLTHQEHVNAGWRSEGLGVFGWALGKYQLPRYDQQVLAADLGEPLGFMSPDARAIVDEATLRHPEDIDRMAERYFSIHWRLRQFSLDGKATDFLKVAQEAWFGPMETSELEFIENDLAIGGVPVSKADANIVRQATSIARERQQAANWLVGTDPIYSEVTCDT